MSSDDLSLGLGRSLSVITDTKEDLMSIIFDCNGECFQWIGRISQRHLILQEIGRDAANEELSITWDDAAWIHSVIREQFPPATIASKFFAAGASIGKMLALVLGGKRREP